MFRRNAAHRAESPDPRSPREIAQDRVNDFMYANLAFVAPIIEGPHGTALTKLSLKQPAGPWVDQHDGRWISVTDLPGPLRVRGFVGMTAEGDIFFSKSENYVSDVATGSPYRVQFILEYRAALL